MPAKSLHRLDKEGTYHHIYNKGVEKRIIFNDKEDYEVFLGYLKEYLTPPQDRESTKKVFTVHGRTFRGTPHQPKNYFNKIELVAYSLIPDQFHLVLHQITKGSLESFIRSLCTRYSIYFNKKHKRTGALYEGPYKSALVKDDPSLLFLTRYLHSTQGNSSYLDYLGERQTQWVKSEGVLSYLDKAKTDSLKDVSDYKNFVEKHELSEKEKEFLKGIIFENETQYLERITTKNVTSQPTETVHIDQNLSALQRIPEFAATLAVFLLLLTLGIRNITISTAKSPEPTPTPIVLSTTEAVDEEPIVIEQPVATTEAVIEPKPSEEPTETLEPKATEEPAIEAEPKIILTIKIDNDTDSVNIRQKPTTDSEKIGKAKNGDTFEFVSLDSEWYGVKLPDGSTGYISVLYLVKEVTNN